MNRGTRIVLTAPFTEMIDHAGYFTQMGMASIPIWMEWVMDKKYPEWRNVKLFDAIKANPHRESFRVLLGGSGGWQITQRKSMERLGIDCVIDGRSESAETIALFHRAIEGGELPQHAEVDHPTDGNTLLFPDRPTTQVMPSKGVPFNIEDWQSVVIRGLEVLNRNNWFPMLTLMVGAPGETDEDVKATLDLVYEMERHGLFGFLVPAVFTPLEGTRMEHGKGVTETRNLSRPQWQLILRGWKMNMRPGLYSWWGPTSFKIGGVGLWALRLRKTNGPNFTWPMMIFCSAPPENLLYAAGKLYKGQPIKVKTRAELLASIKPNYWKYLREDAGDIPAAPPPPAPSEAVPQLEAVQQPVAKAPLHSTGHASRLTALLLAHIGSTMLACRALSAGRLTGLGATRGFTTGC